MTSLMPYSVPQYSDSNGTPLSGGQLYFYSPGTTTLKSIYSDSSGTVTLSNPLTLDSAGRVPSNGIWISGYYDVKLVDASGVTVWTAHNVSSMASTTLALTEWVSQSGTFTYLSATQFSTPGDVTGTFQVNRRVQAVVSAGTIYGTITASSYASGVTTVTVSWDSGSLDSGLSAVNVGILAANNQSVPTLNNINKTGTDSGVETLTNKTLTSPAISNASSTGTDSGVETLQNKTLDSTSSAGAAIFKTQNDVTSSRALNTNYQNTTGKTMMVNVTVRQDSTTDDSLILAYSNATGTYLTTDQVDAFVLPIYNSDYNHNHPLNTASFLVLPGNYYVVGSYGTSVATGNAVLTQWVEWY